MSSPIYYSKVLIQWVLLAMICYSAHLGLRDSDKSTYENRFRESLKFIEKNHPGYRLYMIDQLGIDRKNCTKEQIPNLKDMAPMYVLAHSQWGVLSAVFILLNSRCGCILASVHAGILALGANMYSLRPLFLKFITWYYRHGTSLEKFPSPCLPKKEFLESELHLDKSDAFQEAFFAKQKTWKTGLGFAITETILCALLAVLITLQK